jgi:outer membrane lipoprotein-sorting protein
MTLFRRIGAGAALIVTLIAMAAPAFAETAMPAVLSPDDRADVARIEQYLNDLTTLSARFTQVASTGEVSGGRFYMSRPGKMRFEYDPPVPILLVATGTLLVYVDKELQQVSQVLQNTTPVGVLVRKDVKLEDGTTIVGFERRPGVIRVAMTETDHPEQGSIALVFADRPLMLRQWHVTDARGTVTTVTLSNVRSGMPLDGALFQVESDPFKPFSVQ